MVSGRLQVVSDGFGGFGWFAVRVVTPSGDPTYTVTRTFGHVVLRDHVINLKHLISNTTVLMTKLGSGVIYPPTKSHDLRITKIFARTHDKLKA